MKKYLPIALMLGFLVVGLSVFIASKPTTKAPIYKSITKYSPYYLDKRFGGLQILKRDDKEFKEKPINADLFKRYEYLQKEWGKKHLKRDGDILVIESSKGTIKVPLKSVEDREFIKNFYGI